MNTDKRRKAITEVHFKVMDLVSSDEIKVENHQCLFSLNLLLANNQGDARISK